MYRKINPIHHMYTARPKLKFQILTNVFFILLSACSSEPSISSSSTTSSKDQSSSVSLEELSSLIYSQNQSSTNSNSYYTPRDIEFRYLAQDWKLSISNTNLFPLESNQYFVQQPQHGNVTIGATDAIGFAENQHGGRMIRSLNTYYSEVGVEALAYNGSLINNPYFYDEDDYTKSGLYVDLPNLKATFNFYTMAMFLEAHADEKGPKLFMNASTTGIQFQEERLGYDDWSSAAWRMVENKNNLFVPVAYHSYQIAR